jgi:tRNA threonylcarbamoyladenosine biosynthesis protein TsaB
VKVIILETATEYCSVALADGPQLIIQVMADGPHQHASHLTVYLQRALAESGHALTDFEAIALGHGPGSFTGLRVGAAVVKGLCLARPALKFMTVDALQATANAMIHSVPQATAADRFFPTVASRRGEVYTRPYSRHGVADGPLASVKLAENPFGLANGGVAYVGGNGVFKVAQELEQSNDMKFLSGHGGDAKQLLPLVNAKLESGDFIDYADYEPLYLKPPFVTKSTKKLL